MKLLPAPSRYGIALAFVFLAVLLYLPSQHYDFVYDDDAVLRDNRFVKAGTNGLTDIWTTTYFEGYNPNIVAQAYRPIPLTLSALEVEYLDQKPATGPEQQNWVPNPTIYHRSNLLLYGLCCGALFLFCARCFGARRGAFVSVAATLLWLVHPIHLEVVANIKSRDTLLGFLFWMTAAGLFLRHIDTKKWGWLVASLGAFTLGLFSKEEVITGLAVLPALLWFFRNKRFRKHVWKTALYLVPTVLFLVLRFALIGERGVEIKQLDNSLLGATDFWGARLPSNLFSVGYFLKQALFPNVLLSDYSYSTLPLVSWENWRPWASLAGYALLGFLTVRGWQSRKLYAFGALYFGIAISIFTSIVTPNVSVYNDRFLFNGSLGMVLVVGGVLQWLVPKTGPFWRRHAVVLPLVGLLTGAAVWKVRTHLPYWQDRYVLFAYEAAASPENARMQKNHGGSLARQAMAAQGDEQRRLAESALVYLNRALDIYPRQATGWVHLGNMYFLLRRYDEAVDAQLQALALDRNNHHAKTTLANIYYRRGQYADGLALVRSLDERRFNANDYYLAALLHERAPDGDATTATRYRKLAGR